MESLYLLIPVSIILVFAVGVAFWFSLRGGQFEDLEGPAYRVVMDDDRPPPADRPEPVDMQNDSPAKEKNE